VPHFAAPRTPKKLHFPHRKRRKIVVEHEAFLGFAFEGFEALFVVAGA